MMMDSCPTRMGFLRIVAMLGLLSATTRAAPVVVDFDSKRWDLQSAEIVDYLGRRSLAGATLVKDLEFSNGVIEFDVAVDGRRSYPGIVFRMKSEDDYERFYLRPHRAGLYPDALQYVPVFNGVAGWQLYHGDGYTASADLPENQWVTVRMEILGTQARVFLDHSDQPALVIHDLKHGQSKGTIGLMGPKDGTAYFSNFRYEVTDDLVFETPPETITPTGTLTEWEISRPFPADQIDRTTYPYFFRIFQAEWRTVTAEASGLINISRHIKKTGPGPQCVLARTVVHTRKNRNVKLSLGYSDDVTVFLNGKPVFSGVSGYRSRDPSFVGAVGLFDTVYLPLRKGLNEIFLMLTDSFGGWGFMGRTDRVLSPPVKQHELLTKVWETPPVFKIPESVLYDPQRDILYVSSFDRVESSHIETGFISRMKTNGEIVDLSWVTGLDGPCGMAIRDDRLLVVEGFRGNLVEIDIETGKIMERHRIPGYRFLNDIAVDAAGTTYISNTSRALRAKDVYTFKDGRCAVWKTGDELHRSNGLFIHDDHLIAGNSGDGLLKRVGLDDGDVSVVTSLGAGVIDGIRVDNDRNYLVSHWEGQVYRISPSGEVVELLDTLAAGYNCADFEFIKAKNLLIIPTFLGNRVAAYRLESQ